DGPHRGENPGQGNCRAAGAGTPTDHQPDGCAQAERGEGAEGDARGGQAAEEDGAKQARPGRRRTQAKVRLGAVEKVSGTLYLVEIIVFEHRRVPDTFSTTG